MGEVKQLDWYVVYNYENTEDGFYQRTSKAQVEGGWIFLDYVESKGQISTSMCFVPDALKDNEQVNTWSQDKDDYYLQLAKRIKKLEISVNEISIREDDDFVKVSRSVEKLEKRLTELEDWTRKDEETIKGRIKKLEETKNITPYIQIPREYDERITSLEKRLSELNKDCQQSIDNIQNILDRNLDMHNEHYGNHQAAMKEIQYLINSDDDELIKIGKEERQTGYLNGIEDFFKVLDRYKGYLTDSKIDAIFEMLKNDAESNKND